MAYVVTRTVGSGGIEYLIEGTSIGTSDVAVLDDFPAFGEIERQDCELVSGAGTTIQPIVARTRDSTGADIAAVTLVAAAAAYISEAAPVPFSSTGKLYFQAQVDAGADNVVSARILVTANLEG